MISILFPVCHELLAVCCTNSSSLGVPKEKQRKRKRAKYKREKQTMHSFQHGNRIKSSRSKESEEEEKPTPLQPTAHNSERRPAVGQAAPKIRQTKRLVSPRRRRRWRIKSLRVSRVSLSILRDSADIPVTVLSTESGNRAP